MDQEVFSDLNTLNKVSKQQLNVPPYVYLLPDGEVNFEEIDADTGKLKVLMFSMISDTI
jgi:hypothetical protein